MLGKGVLSRNRGRGIPDWTKKNLKIPTEKFGQDDPLRWREAAPPFFHQTRIKFDN